MLVQVSLVILFLFDFCGSAVLYRGKGQIYFTYDNEFTESGTTVLYRPDNYLRYSPVGEGRNAYFDFSSHLTEFDARNNSEKLLSRRGSWREMKWDPDGKYYHLSNLGGNMVTGHWYGYGVAIYNFDFHLIYEDIKHVYEVPKEITYCVIGNVTQANVTKCSEVLGELNNWSPRQFDGGKAAAIIIPILVIVVAVIIVFRVKKKQERSGEETSRCCSRPTSKAKAISYQRNHSRDSNNLANKVKVDHQYMPDQNSQHTPSAPPFDLESEKYGYSDRYYESTSYA